MFGQVDESIEDFVIPAQPKEILVEVKSFDESASLGELTKVNMRVDQYEREREQVPRVVLLVSQWSKTALSERPSDREYPDNIKNWAADKGYALVSVLELYRAVCAWRGERLGAEAVLSRHAAGRGPTTLVHDSEEWIPDGPRP